MIPKGSGISGNVSQSGVKKSPPDALEGSNEGFLAHLSRHPIAYRIITILQTKGYIARHALRMQLSRYEMIRLSGPCTPTAIVVVEDVDERLRPAICSSQVNHSVACMADDNRRRVHDVVDHGGNPSAERTAPLRDFPEIEQSHSDAPERVERKHCQVIQHTMGQIPA